MRSWSPPKRSGTLVVTAAGEEIASTAVVLLPPRSWVAFPSTEVAATVGGYARVASYAIGAAKIVNSCTDGLTAECQNAISELIVSYGLNAVGALLESPAYELANSVRELLNNLSFPKASRCAELVGMSTVDAARPISGLGLAGLYCLAIGAVLVLTGPRCTGHPAPARPGCPGRSDPGPGAARRPPAEARRRAGGVGLLFLLIWWIALR